MRNKILPIVFIVFIQTIFINKVYCQSISYAKLDDGVVLQLPLTYPNAPKAIKVQVISENIIHVLASPIDTFREDESLMINPTKRTLPRWTLSEKQGQITISTATINANINTINGNVAFTNKNGQLILTEKKIGSKILAPTVADGEGLFSLQSTFITNENESFYGLGQHQNGTMNYQGKSIELLQNNTDVAIPFLVSSKNYGILWDNYSITRAVDTREFEQLNTLKLFDADGNEGWLTATYASKKNNTTPIIKAESKIDYEFIETMKTFPDSFKLSDGIVTWNGYLQSAFEGKHSFLLKNAGYIKVWMDDELVAEKWRQAWNPGSSLIEVNLASNKKHKLKIEWIPDGGESYISLKWMRPQTIDEQHEFGFKSEAGRNIDYYFVYGNNIDEVIGAYRQLTGKANIPPRWALGFWQSRERYKTQNEILQTVGEFRKRNIPIDNIVLDWNYWEQDKWGSQQFDTTRFPDAKGMIDDLHNKYHAHFMISVWPKFYEGIESYKYFDANGWLYKRNIVDKQRDWIGKGYVSTFYDAYNAKARTAFWNLMNENLFTKGVDAWWMDASEPDIFSNSNPAHRKLLMTPTAIGSSTQYFNAFPLQNAKGIYEGQRGTSPNQRVFTLTRSAYAGIQRYSAATWSGDIAARWEDFRNQIPAGINFCLSGAPYWTTDIGGFAVERKYERAKGKDLDDWRELSTRWYQYGSFCPLFRVHGQLPYREIFNIAPEGSVAYESMLYYDKLRYRLMPYIYSLAGKTYHENYTIMRGLAMDFGKDDSVKNIANQFMFGPAILVNPVTDLGATQRKLYLPATTGWYDFYTGNYCKGGQHITADAPLSKIPLFLKEGSIIPVGPAIQYTGERAADTITLYVYTGKDASFTLYEDEGLNYNYEKGAYSTIAFHYSEANKVLTIGERIGSFEGMLTSRIVNIVWVTKNDKIGFDTVKKPNVTAKYVGKKLLLCLE